VSSESGMAIQFGPHNPLVVALIRAGDLINRVTEYVIAAMMAAMTIIIALQVFYRYVLNDPLSWTEEISRYLMIWICFLGSAMALKYGEHISVTFLQERLPLRIRQVVGYGIGLTVLAFFSLATWEGVLMTIQVSEQQAPATWISMAWAYSCIPVGCSFMMFHALVHLIRYRGNPVASASAGERPL
jgi:TRAP-type C4-dicarboxylate transport system permease small subunit